MPKAITDLAQATPDWLTCVLAANGYLDWGKVVSIQRSPPRTTWAAIVSHLGIVYSSDAPPSTPRRLFLKFTRPDLDEEDREYGAREVAFYGEIATTMIDPPLARCYEAVHDPQTGAAHVLLDDLSATHVQPRWPLPPLESQCGPIVDALAQVHAHWWDHPRLGDMGEPDTRERQVRWAEKAFPDFVDAMQDRLSVARREQYEQVLSSWPPSRLADRLAEGRGFTLIHGDAHIWNFFCPRAPCGRVRIVDWHEWCVSTSAYDLVETIVLTWYPGRRARMERALLKRYHERLLAHGVRNYDWQQCWDDYRTSVIGDLFIPVWQWALELHPDVWWTNQEKLMAAFEELECADLLEN